MPPSGYAQHDMALRATTIRFDVRAATYVAQAAGELGISVSQFVREAALIRSILVIDAHDREIDAHELERWRTLAQRVADLSRVDSQDED